MKGKEAYKYLHNIYHAHIQTNVSERHHIIHITFYISYFMSCIHFLSFSFTHNIKIESLKVCTKRSKNIKTRITVKKNTHTKPQNTVNVINWNFRFRVHKKITTCFCNENGSLIFFFFNMIHMPQFLPPSKQPCVQPQGRALRDPNGLHLQM